MKMGLDVLETSLKFVPQRAPTCEPPIAVLGGLGYRYGLGETRKAGQLWTANKSGGFTLDRSSPVPGSRRFFSSMP